MSANGRNKGVKGVEGLKALGVQVRDIVRPANVNDARDIVIKARREKLTIFPIGGGTTPSTGMLPESIDIVLDTTGMKDVVSFDSANLNITVQAGITIDAINEHIGNHGRGFCLPLDPPFSDSATIGGVYAANVSGPSRLRFGTVRDQVLGVQGINANGDQVKFGGKVVKNVSGYDMTKFLIGSSGSFCLITALTFRVYPMPVAAGLCEVKLRRLDEVEKLLEALKTSVLIPSAVVVELVNGEYRIVAGFEENAKAVERECSDFLTMAKAAGGKGVYRQGRKAMQEVLRETIEPNEEPFAIKMTVPISRGPKTVSEVKRVMPHSKAVLYAGNGVINVYSSPEDIDLIALKQLQELVKQMDGYIAPLRLPKTILSGWGSRVNAALDKYMLQPIKQQLDPTGIFPQVLQ